MARRNRRQADRNGDALSGVPPQANNEPKEGQEQVTHPKEGQEGPPKWLIELHLRQREVWRNNPLYLELERQRIRLQENGYETEWGMAQVAVEALREINKDEWAADFATLVALVKPRGATTVASMVTPKAVDSLLENQLHVMNDDGTVKEVYAKVLDAAYVEVDGGVVLRDPVAYPSREWVEKYAPIDRKVQSELERIHRVAAKEAVEELRRMRDPGDGRSL